MGDSFKPPTFAVRCPNHGCPLEDCGFPLPKKGSGTCPVSGAKFTFEAVVDESKTVVDKFGNKEKAVGWSLSGSD